MPFLAVFIILLEKSQSLFPFKLSQQQVKQHSLLGWKLIIYCYLSDFLQQGRKRGRNRAIPEISWNCHFFILLCNLQNKVRMLHTSTWTTPKDHRYMWKCNTPFLFPLLLFSLFYFTHPSLNPLQGSHNRGQNFYRVPQANTTWLGTKWLHANHIKRYRANLGAGLQLTSGCKVLTLVCKPMWYSAFDYLPASSRDSSIFHVETMCFYFCTKATQD